MIKCSNRRPKFMILNCDYDEAGNCFDNIIIIIYFVILIVIYTQNQ